ncbi:MAG: hypothetical protein R3C59_22070 [Planctomycetaceae bacterium]
MVRPAAARAYLDTVFISDDAAAFRLLGFFLRCAGCIRNATSASGSRDDPAAASLDQTRDDIWKYISV